MSQYYLELLPSRLTELQGVVRALRDAGERVLEETILNFPEFESGACFVIDPDGQLIELVQAPGDPSAPPRAG